MKSRKLFNFILCAGLVGTSWGMEPHAEKSGKYQCPHFSFTRKSGEKEVRPELRLVVQGKTLRYYKTSARDIFIKKYLPRDLRVSLEEFPEDAMKEITMMDYYLSSRDLKYVRDLRITSFEASSSLKYFLHEGAKAGLQPKKLSWGKFDGQDRLPNLKDIPGAILKHVKKFEFLEAGWKDYNPSYRPGLFLLGKKSVPLNSFLGGLTEFKGCFFSGYDGTCLKLPLTGSLRHLKILHLKTNAMNSELFSRVFFTPKTLRAIVEKAPQLHDLTLSFQNTQVLESFRDFPLSQVLFGAKNLHSLGIELHRDSPDIKYVLEEVNHIPVIRLKLGSLSYGALHFSQLNSTPLSSLGLAVYKANFCEFDISCPLDWQWGKYRQNLKQLNLKVGAYFSEDWNSLFYTSFLSSLHAEPWPKLECFSYECPSQATLLPFFMAIDAPRLREAALTWWLKINKDDVFQVLSHHYFKQVILHINMSLDFSEKGRDLGEGLLKDIAMFLKNTCARGSCVEFTRPLKLKLKEDAVFKDVQKDVPEYCARLFGIDLKEGAFEWALVSHPPLVGDEKEVGQSLWIDGFKPNKKQDN